MAKKSKPIRHAYPKLIVINNDKKRDIIARLKKFKKKVYKPQILLPPQRENYIIAKKHDFL